MALSLTTVVSTWKLRQAREESQRVRKIFGVGGPNRFESSLIADPAINPHRRAGLQLIRLDHPLAWPIALGGDKGYRADWIDEYLLKLDMQPVIPSKENEDRTKRLVKFDRKLYKQRHIIECLIGWLKESRRIFSSHALKKQPSTSVAF